MRNLDPIKLHNAGAIINHKSPFDNLKSTNNEKELSKEFIQQWVLPFFGKIGNTDELFFNQLVAQKSSINSEIIKLLLGDFNWRTRQTGAFFAAITDRTNFIDEIGHHLLKSELCYVGEVYSIVLAYFNTEKSVNYLNTYLEYYLLQKDLFFDQRVVMETIRYLDKINETNFYFKHLNSWLEFVAGKQGWSGEIETSKIEEQISFINSVAKHEPNCP